MKRIEHIEVGRIRARNRIRKETGDLSDLMASMRKHGLMNPITVTGDYTLIAGQRRLEAARRLGWNAIQCRVVDDATDESLVELEIEENSTRKDFTSDEMADAILRLDRIKNPGWWRRVIRWFRRLLRRLGLRR
ncbi:MAG: ParB N-terminal domain-containing protein [Spirochaeta sp.]|nr:ParB N-terminal domain-containing protein [Spirochaeta sp.]